MRKLTAILLLFSLTLSAQKIEKTKGELSTSSSSRPSSSSSSGGSECGDCDGFFLDFFIEGFSGLMRAMVGYYSEEEHLHNQLTAYPYAYGAGGNYTEDSVAKKNFRIDFEDQFL